MSPQSLDQIFSKDPKTLTDDEVRIIVKRLEAERENWLTAEPKASKAKKTAASPTLSLEDLGDLEL